MKIIYTGAARASTPHACATRLYSRVRAYIHTHTYVHVERCSLSLRPPIPYCLSFMGTLLTFYRRAVARISTVFFFSFFFLLSLSLPSSVHLPFHHPPTKHPPVSPVPKSCMKMIFFFFFHSPSLRLETFRTAFLTDDCLHLSRYRSQLDRGETRE